MISAEWSENTISIREIDGNTGVRMKTGILWQRNGPGSCAQYTIYVLPNILRIIQQFDLSVITEVYFTYLIKELYFGTWPTKFCVPEATFIVAIKPSFFSPLTLQCG